MGEYDMATHLPDLVVNFDHLSRRLPAINSFHAVVMFLDVSGFTALTEKYSLNKKTGTAKLSRTLNGYMGAMVQEIISYDGDVIKYAGDAILCLWQLNKQKYHDLQKIVQQCIRCGLTIQRKWGEWMTDVGVTLKVKIGMSAGNVRVMYVGNDYFRHYIAMGYGIEAVNQAEKFCASGGDLVLSPYLWCHVQNREKILHEKLHDGKHIKILNSQEVKDIQVTFMSPSNMTYENHKTVEATESWANVLEEYEKKADQSDQQKIGMEKTREVKVNKKKKAEDKMRVRKSILSQPSESINSKIRLYVMEPVKNIIDENQPLEYLSEMRQVTILFINIVTDIDPTHRNAITDTANAIQATFQIVYAWLKKLNGALNKIFTFDKGLTYLAVFGLPGFKSESDCRSGLQCAYRMRNELVNLSEISTVSIGVTTGSTYVGVVGHKHRHEYTVIGRKVNMAARLMMHYNDKVTCDNETYQHSKLKKKCFVTQEVKEMKGLQNVGLIREFIETKIDDDDGVGDLIFSLDESEYPLIGRQEEMEQILDEMFSHEKPTSPKMRKIICIRGESGIGKTRILDAIVAAHLRHLKKEQCMAYGVTVHDHKEPFLLIKTLLCDLLEMESCTNSKERERVLTTSFQDRFIVERLPLLNKMFNVKLPPYNGSSNFEDMCQLLEAMLLQLLSVSRPYFILVIDDFHFVDKESVDFFERYLKQIKFYMVISVRSDFYGGDLEQRDNVIAEKLLSSDDAKIVNLHGLSTGFLAGLICQYIGVVKIPQLLLKVLGTLSRGVPYWCEQYLLHMYVNEAVAVVDFNATEELETVTVSEGVIEKRRLSRGGRLSADSNLAVSAQGIEKDMQRLSIDSQDGKTANTITGAKGLKMLVIKNTVGVMTVPVPETIKGAIQANIDRMNNADQIVIKTCAVLGYFFDRPLLRTVLPPTLDEKCFEKVLRNMYRRNILECTSLAELDMEHKMSKPDQEEIYCCCIGNDEKSNAAKCEQMQFVSACVQETAYDMFLENTRNKFHLKAAQHLEFTDARCLICGTTLAFTPKYTLRRATLAGSMALLSVNADAGRRRSSQRRKSSVNPEQIKKSMEQAFTDRRRRSSELRGLEYNSIVDKDEWEKKLNCKCMNKKVDRCQQLVRHWRACADVDKTVFYLMELGSSLIAAFENEEALQTLNEVIEIMSNKKKGLPLMENVKINTKFTLTPTKEAQLLNLLAQAHFNMGELKVAAQNFTNALRLLGCQQPKNAIGYRAKYMTELYLYKMIARFPKKYLDLSVLVKEVYLAQADVLNHFIEVLIATGEVYRAKVVAIQMLNKAHQIKSDIVTTILAFECCIKVCILDSSRGGGSVYYEQARDYIKEIELDTTELQIAGASLYTTSAIYMLYRKTAPKAIKCGKYAMDLLNKSCDFEAFMKLLPYMHAAYMLTAQSENAIQMTTALSSMADNNSSTNWYCVFALDILLEAGIKVIKVSQLTKSADEMFEDALISDNLSLCSVAASMALWYARKSSWMLSEQWQERYHEIRPAVIKEYIAALAYLRFIETRLIKLASLSKVHQLSSPQFKAEVKNLDALFKDIRVEVLPTMPVLTARYQHLRAYYHLLKQTPLRPSLALSKSLKSATQHENILETNWLAQSKDYWFDKDNFTKESSVWDHQVSQTRSKLDTTFRGADWAQYTLHLYAQAGKSDLKVITEE